MQSPPASPAFDSAKPFRGVVVCCTSIPPEQRTEIARTAQELGGIHKYDLTPDVTHLIVGEYDTAKYRHVAKERPDIKVMSAGWINVIRNLWVADQEIDFPALESEWKLQAFETCGGQNKQDRGRLLCCLTGFEEAQRQYIETTVKANGGDYTGDLSRKVTHLIVCKPEGRKYQAAKNWGIITVSIEWLDQSVERGMILDEKCYDPILPAEERGRGAWTRKEIRRVSTGKRLRDEDSTAAEEGRRKLRRSASMKFNQGNGVWGDFMRESSADPSRPGSRMGLEKRAASVSGLGQSANSFHSALGETALPDPVAASTPALKGVFSSCRFFVHGFEAPRFEIVCQHLSSHGGQIASSLADVASPAQPESPDWRFLIVPQKSQPDTHPQLPEGVHIITEFYIERCLHHKQLSDPNEHVLGRPFPQFPIAGFQNLTIATAGFRDEQLQQVQKATVQLGAQYSEILNARCSVLVCPTIDGVREQKLKFALLSKIPVVSADWFWQCISSGFLVPWEKFEHAELKHKLAIDVDPELEKERLKLQRSKSAPAVRKAKPDLRAPGQKEVMDKTAFDKDMSLAPGKGTGVVQKPKTDESQYETAPTYQAEESLDERQTSAPLPAPLSEMSTSAINKSPSPPKTNQAPGRQPLHRIPTTGTIGDSEAGDESDATSTATGALIENDDLVKAIQAARRRKLAPDEDAKTKERQAISKLLIDTLDHHQQQQQQQQGSSVDIISNLNANKSGSVGASHTRPHRRKREVFGRAISNVSAASSNSADSSNAREAIQSAPGALGSGAMLDPLALNGEERSNKADDERPAATQIDYDNPEARRQREAIMDRMLGVESKTEPVHQTDKKTMGNLKSDAGVGGSVTAAGRRTRRKAGF